MNLVTVTLQFLFAHFLADFIFQTAAMVEWKTKSKAGLLFHGLIHWLTALALVIFILPPFWAVSLTLFVSIAHMFIDQHKITHQGKKIGLFRAFWLDQLIHYLTIALLVFSISFFPQLLSQLPMSQWWGDQGVFPIQNIVLNPIILAYLIIVIFVSRTLELSVFQKLRETNSHANLHFNNRRIIKRLFLITLFFLLIIAWQTVKTSFIL